MIRIIHPGPLATVQDLGRVGLAHLGIGRSGAADTISHLRANHLVGNPGTAATIELTLGRLRAEFDQDAVIAITGAPAPVGLDGTGMALAQPIDVRAGQQLRIGAATAGLRSYLAVAGGIDVLLVLGSRSTDTLSGIGPAPLAAGTRLPIGPPVAGPPPAEVPPGNPFDPAPIGVRLGPRDDWFTRDAVPALTTATWTVSTGTNRIGARLTGPELTRRHVAELPSEPMVLGALQVPPTGQPIIFLADHPVTGGYPVIAVIDRADLPRAAQLRPGQRLTFRVR